MSPPLLFTFRIYLKESTGHARECAEKSEKALTIPFGTKSLVAVLWAGWSGMGRLRVWVSMDCRWMGFFEGVFSLFFGIGDEEG